MCDIWSKPDRNELPPEFYRRLPTSLTNINVSGGEPFLRDDLPEIAAAFHDHADTRMFSLPTNGSLPARILPAIDAMATRCRDATINLIVSLDAVGERHDALRGVPGGFARAQMRWSDRECGTGRGPAIAAAGVRLRP